MPTLKVIIASTRPGRVGLPVSQWFVEVAKKAGTFNVEVLDLAEINLPFFDEPNHPAQQMYTKDHTKKWSAQIDSADAFVVVIPEYNFTMPATLLNAFDYLYKEWNYKAVGFVSYGGISGGTRSVQTAKLFMTTFKMMPIYEAVTIPSISQHIKEGKFEATENNEKSAVALLAELAKWTGALQTLRVK
jgi:NAD(P)H-dependent FMN reductase